MCAWSSAFDVFLLLLVLYVLGGAQQDMLLRLPPPSMGQCVLSLFGSEGFFLLALANYYVY